MSALNTLLVQQVHVSTRFIHAVGAKEEREDVLSIYLTNQYTNLWMTLLLQSTELKMQHQLFKTLLCFFLTEESGNIYTWPLTKLPGLGNINHECCLSFYMTITLIAISGSQILSIL